MPIKQSNFLSATYTGPQGPQGPQSLSSMPDGTAEAPGLPFADNTATGLYRPAANTLGFSTASAERVRITSIGRVGIGTTTPSQRLETYDAAGADNIVMATRGDGASMFMQADATGDVGTINNYPVRILQNNTERLRIDSSGNVGIGTSSPTDKVKIVGGNTQVPRNSLIGSSATGNAIQVTVSGGSQIQFVQNGSDDELSFITHAGGVSHIEQARITGAGLFKFNSGYGSVATAFGCRAWVNFNGTGAVAIRASGNVSSITDNGQGSYTINFTNAMSDENYATYGSCRPTAGGPPHYVFYVENKDYTNRTTSAIQIYFLNPTSQVTADPEVVSFAVIR